MEGIRNGMDARSLDYVLGVEDCANMVYDFLESAKDMANLKKAIEVLLVDTRVIRSCKFLEDNGLYAFSNAEQSILHYEQKEG